MIRWSLAVFSVVFFVMVFQFPTLATSMDYLGWGTILVWGLGLAAGLAFIKDIFRSILKV